MNVNVIENRDLLHPKWVAEVTAFMQPQQIDNPSVDGTAIKLPAPCLLFAHDGIDSRMMFKHDAHQGKSVFQSVYELWASTANVSDFI